MLHIFKTLHIMLLVLAIAMYIVKLYDKFRILSIGVADHLTEVVVQAVQAVAGLSHHKMEDCL